MRTITSWQQTLAGVALLAMPALLDAQAQSDIRWEKQLAAGSVVRVHNLSGNVSVTVADVQAVEVVGVRTGDRDDFDRISMEVVETSRGIVVCPTFEDAETECDEEGFNVRDRRRGRDRHWHLDADLDIRVRMPRSMVAQASSISGDVHIVGAEGEVRGSSVSGDVRMEQLRATAVRGSSVSGDVRASILALTGSGDLRFNSVSGDVEIELPRDVGASVSMRSVSGELDSDFAMTLQGRMSRNRLEARIGNGGRELEVHTVSGDVRLRARPQG